MNTRVELLESRIAPAGIVMVDYDPATGELTMTGDAMNNSMAIFQTGPSTYRLESETTSINILGVNILDLGKLTRVTFDGGAGEDGLGLSNVRTLTALSFSGGAGDDSFFANNLTVKGDVEIHGNADDDTVRFDGLSTLIAGNLRIDSAVAATDSMEVQFNAQKTVIGGSVRFAGGGGPDILQASGAGPVSIAKGVDFNSGAGGGQLAFLNHDLLKIGKLATGESILFTGGGGSDTLTFDGANATLSSGIRMTSGALDDSISMGSGRETMKIGKLATGESIRFDGGADGDTISTNAASLTLAGGIDFAAGDGVNAINLAGDNGVLKVGKLAGGQSILFAGGSVSDDITCTLAKVTLAGGIEHNAGGGSNSLEFDSLGVVKFGKFGTGQSIKFTGTGNASNRVDLGGSVALAGSVEVTGGTSSDTIDFDGKVSVGKSAAGVSVLLTGGDGDDSIDFQDRITLTGSLKLEGGNNDDEMDLNDVDTLAVKGSVEFDGGAGADNFQLVAFSVALGSTLTIMGGDDADTVSISTGGSIKGNVSVDLGGAAAGSQTMFLSSSNGLTAGLVLKGGLVVNASGVATADALTISNVSVGRIIDLELGDGVSTVEIDNLIAGDQFMLDTRGGADVVNIERANLFGASVIKKLATILTGDGDDQLAIGGPNPAIIVPFPDHTRVKFGGGLTTDGGAHAAGDDRNDFGIENDFGVPLTPPSGFEMMTIV